MIKTVSQLLEKILVAENEALQKQNIKHRPTIGDMYEGLTKALLDHAIPSSAQLDVSAGFITDQDGNLSPELDCLLVSGSGEEVPYTDKRKFLIDDVIAVIQVKKNLYAADIEDGYNNLLSIMKFQPTRSVRAVLLQDAFQSITRRPLPQRTDVEKLPLELQMIYHALVVELAAPVRVILGYNGFKSHSRFRQSFVDYLSANSDGQPRRGFGPTSFPNLIVCGQFSLVKCTGMPFIAPLDEDLFWPFYCSSVENPLELLLQLIWTRLVYQKQLDPSVFDEDVWLSTVKRFLSARLATTKEGQRGWAYLVTSASDEDLQVTSAARLWEPVFLDRTQFVVMNRLCNQGQVDLSDTTLNSFLEENDWDIESFVKSLNSAGLAARDEDTLVLLTRGCACVILPDGRFAAGENLAGQLTRWLSIYMTARKGQPPHAEATTEPAHSAGSDASNVQQPAPE